MKLFRILHLSDIHIGDTYMDSSDIAYRIISDIESEILMESKPLLSPEIYSKDVVVKMTELFLKL